MSRRHTHIFWTSLNQPLESSISRFIDSIPFTGRSTGSFTDNCCRVPMMRTALKTGRWTLFFFPHPLWGEYGCPWNGPLLLLSYTGRSWGGPEFFPRLWGPPQWSKNTSSNIIAVPSSYSSIGIGEYLRRCCVLQAPQIASISLSIGNMWARYFHKRARVSEKQIEWGNNITGKLTEKHVFVMFLRLCR